jgi:hypothetical protein
LPTWAAANAVTVPLTNAGLTEVHLGPVKAVPAVLASAGVATAALRARAAAPMEALESLRAIVCILPSEIPR